MTEKWYWVNQIGDVDGCIYAEAGRPDDDGGNTPPEQQPVGMYLTLEQINSYKKAMYEDENVPEEERDFSTDWPDSFCGNMPYNPKKGPK